MAQEGEPGDVGLREVAASRAECMVQRIELGELARRRPAAAAASASARVDEPNVHQTLWARRPLPRRRLALGPRQRQHQRPGPSLHFCLHVRGVAALRPAVGGDAPAGLHGEHPRNKRRAGDRGLLGGLGCEAGVARVLSELIQCGEAQRVAVEGEELVLKPGVVQVLLGGGPGGLLAADDHDRLHHVDDPGGWLAELPELADAASREGPQRRPRLEERLAHVVWQLLRERPAASLGLWLRMLLSWLVRAYVIRRLVDQAGALDLDVAALLHHPGDSLEEARPAGQ